MEFLFIIWLCVFVCLYQQRDSGDDDDMDKNSEDEEGQLEEQIERLQEKVESAQSEQKNLFLVIFQVLMCCFVIFPYFFPF